MNKTKNPDEGKWRFAILLILPIVFFVDGPPEAVVWVVLASIHAFGLKANGWQYYSVGCIFYAFNELMVQPYAAIAFWVGTALLLYAFIKDINHSDDDDGGSAEMVKEEQEKQITENQRALAPQKTKA